jgi:aminoglycoside 6'-N-acetyltransferase I
MEAMMQIVDGHAAAEPLLGAAAALLVEGFREHWPEAWPTLADAVEEVDEMLAPERVMLVAVEGEDVLGWVGAIPTYDGLVWELHPLVVAADRRRQGVGRALVGELEAVCAARGGLTMVLGSDDDANMTSLGGADIFPDLLGNLAAIRNLRGHPFEFYQRLGFSLSGIVPDANGFGKPDILLAKRIARPPGA